MSGQKYRRTNFEDEDSTSMAETPPGVTYDPAIAFKAGATFWQKRTTLERFFGILLLVLILVVVILAGMLATKQKVIVHIKDKNLCTTPACVTVASSILNAMDVTVDPCEDFYQYACGGWLRAHPIPSGQSRWGTFGVMWKENQLVMKNVLERPLNETDSTAEQKAKQYFQSCMDPDKKVEELGAQPLLDLIKKQGGWNISRKSGEWSPDGWDLQENLIQSHALDMADDFFTLWVGEDEQDPTKNIIQFDQGGLVLARDHYLNKSITDDKLLSAYLKMVTELGVLLGGDRNATEDQMTQVIEFEQALANITTPQEERRDEEKLYNKKTLSELQELAPFINWVEYINGVIKGSGVKKRVDGNLKVVVFAPQFLHDLSDLIATTLARPEGVTILNNYMKFHLVKTMCAYLSKPFQQVLKDFSQVLTGVTGDDVPWRGCTSSTDGVLGYALGAMFVKEAFHGGSKDTAEDMIGEVKMAFKQNLPHLAWMDDETRKAAVDKANSVMDMIGFPAYILNTTALDDRYKELDIKPDEYFMNNLRSLQYGAKRMMDKLNKKPDKTSWSMTPPTVNAYYTPTKNEIVFPAGILQAPFYDKAYPRSLNFGAMGVVMGHELTHGFDDQGREYNKYGVLKQWWNNASIVKFKERAQCVVDQYSKYELHGEHVDGKQTLGENIADNGGLKSAFYAYLDWVQNNGEELPLPGLELSHRQLFFVAFSQVWCSNSRPEADSMLMMTDPHSPSKFRVIGPLSNSYEFSQQFQCKANTAMNPTHKCEVW